MKNGVIWDDTPCDHRHKASVTFVPQAIKYLKNEFLSYSENLIK
jgi:hypothetical protein